MNSKTTDERKVAFCAAVATTGGNISKACAAVGLDRTTLYRWRDDDPDFAKAWDQAKAWGLEALEDEARRRAHCGVEEPVVYQGQFTYLRDTDAIDPTTDKPYEGERQFLAPLLRDADGNPRMASVTKYSDSLMALLLKGGMPEKYRERIEHSGNIDLSGRLAAARERVKGDA